jgi:DEAD/DEAH box helicase domain-containing protein
MLFEIVFDVETKKLFRDTATGDPAELGVSIVSTYYRTVDEFRNIVNEQVESFWERDFPRMWPLFAKADRIIGFNSINFDVPALAPYSPPDFARLKHFDILDIVRNVTGRRFSLNSLAKDTLGEEKTDVGTNAVIYWNKGDEENLAKLKHYCEADVLITRNLYDFGFKNKYLKYTDKWNGVKSLEIDFSYPKPTAPDAQQFSLF